MFLLFLFLLNLPRLFGTATWCGLLVGGGSFARMCKDGVFPKIGGKPQNGWFIMENPIKILLKWMIWGVLPPIFGNT